jgi:hypothetical protein
LLFDMASFVALQSRVWKVYKGLSTVIRRCIIINYYALMALEKEKTYLEIDYGERGGCIS